MGSSRRRTGLVLAVAVAAAALSLWLRSAFPLHVIPAAPDDLLFIRLADHLRHGEWLGPYDSLTLVKGMFYPLFIAAAALLHVPLKMAEHGVYLGAAAALAIVVERLSRSRLLALALFLALAFNPALWTWSLARVIREGLYIGLGLALLAAAAAALTPARLREASRARLAAGGVAAGLVAGAMWLTREEGATMLPMIACLAVFAVAANPFPASGLRRRTAATVAAGTFTVVTMVAAVATANWAKYGVFTDVEFKSPGFQSAYGALSRITHASWQRYVVVPREVRIKAYAASPAAAELAPTIEGPRKSQWMSSGCALQAIDPCPDILASLFMWALRDGADAAGHYRTAASAEAFYEKMAAEINQACDTGRLACLAPRHTFAPPFRAHYIADAFADSAPMTALTLAMGEPEVFSYPETATPDDFRLFSALTGAPPEREPFAVTHFSGWAAGPAALTALEIRDPEGALRGTSTLAATETDVVRDGNGLIPRQFSAAPDCAGAACRAVFLFANGLRREVPLDTLGDYPGRMPDFVLSLDSIGGGPPDVLAAKLKQNRIHFFARTIARLYALTVPVFVLTGLAGLALAAWRFRREPALLFLAGIGAAAAVQAGTRIALLSYLDVTTIPSLLNLYVAPATPFVLVVAVLGNGLAWRALTAKAGS